MVLYARNPKPIESSILDLYHPKTATNLTYTKHWYIYIVNDDTFGILIYMHIKIQ